MYIDMREISKLGNARMKGRVQNGRVPPFFLLVRHVCAGVEGSEGSFPVPLLVVRLVVTLVVVIHPDSATGDNVVSSSQPSVYSLLFHDFYEFPELNFFLVPAHMNLNLTNMPCPSHWWPNCWCKVTAGLVEVVAVVPRPKFLPNWGLGLLLAGGWWCCASCAAAWAEHSSCTSTPHGAAPGQNKAAAAEAGP